MLENDTIIALATPPGTGAIAVMRLSGPGAIALAASHFRAASGKPLESCPGHTVHLGHLYFGERMLDEVLATVFRGPRSYTGEDVVEISCHGSPFIQQAVLNGFLDAGCRMAQAGEFTLRAFLHGKMDLSQAEAVADLIASENQASHQIALQQMRGGYSSRIKELRDQLIHFASLITLELDFSGEDVEFADRGAFTALLDEISDLLKKLIDSFATGNAIKKGIPVAIAGQPNVGKSTLLNTLLEEERAIVSDIAGTTRDAIEDDMVLGGIGFRFIDTAGIRQTEDQIESIGIRKTYEKLGQARIIAYMTDGTLLEGSALEAARKEADALLAQYPEKPVLVLANKADQLTKAQREQITATLPEAHFLSARDGEGVEALKERLLGLVSTGALQANDPVVSNSRHYQALGQALQAVDHIKEGMAAGVPSDLVSVDINEALFHLGAITGEITTDDLLGNIFANFCIGK
ncbi:tRNA uridine-5-carboxymethylaminomethyl(34) synthesis GTPase MnmE [Robiginitalea sp. M366]|uniref:tRNA uridine-5-carboxymethylaminomethyl(34) synthesis GTPase MnmE n=1 Tax=Robiginitalea aestuariiviva TaxID=3036903 RepID=UPI00240D1F85|nr:tRNA uridine-5-carboxymethylaminomethyl(34) synthesis GTPase MnmE [Robiginitalea aestuariiviva]MDG1572752.1 tRNA uridine-5-carboxymethylaminomethyl(34) synthesis GTPase MnmE [Robiginitalea aestuariiviva]